MKEVIESIRKLLQEGVFNDEQHVRFSLVGRICQKLGWDIWNPAEFYTEYKVEKVPTQLLPKDSNGRVDVALFLSDNKPKAAEVFMEIKAPGKLMTSLKVCEDQLHAYTGHHRIAIGILTDGIIWRFYVPAIGGYFKDTLFAQLNLETDEVESLVTFFNDILHRDNFRKKAQDKAEEMFEELGRIILIQKVKPTAIIRADEMGMDVYEAAQRLLRQNEKIEMSIVEITNIWDKTIPGGGSQLPTPQTSPLPSNDVPVYIETRGIKANGFFNPHSNHLILCRGSEIVKDHSISFEGGHLEGKNRMIQSGDLYLDDTHKKYILRHDKHFKTPSGASRLVLGRSSNGFTDWHDADGNPLDIHRIKHIT